MSVDRERTGMLAEKLRKSAIELAQELIERNAHAIAHELLTAAEATGGFNINIGLAMVQGKVAVDGKISWTRKFADKEEATFRFNDPQAPELPGIEGEEGTKVTIRTGDTVIDTSLEKINRAAKKLSQAKGNTP